jgi:hypothetical protein
MKARTLLFGIFFLIGGIIFSCKKEKGTAPIRIYLTDNPALYDSVNVHIVGMQVQISKDGEAWIPIDVKDSIYNLLDLQNGITELIAQDTIPTGWLHEVRFMLGNENTIVVNGVSYPLQAPSAEDSGLKIKIDKQLNTSLNDFTLDFDAELSVKEENGNYRLSPVIRLKP